MLKPALLALLLASAAAPAMAQSSQAATPLPAPTSLPRPLQPIPAPQDRDYPGVIDIEADLTDLDHKVIRVQRRGYKLKDRLLRPANVVVSSGASATGEGA